MKTGEVVGPEGEDAGPDRSHHQRQKKVRGKISEEVL